MLQACNIVRYSGLSFLRGVAAFFIVGCHIGLAPRTVAGELMTWFCDMNVGLFAAISGFLLAHSFDRDEGLIWVRYVKRRVGRLLPIYVVWTIFYLCASLMFALVLKGQLPVDKYSNPRFWVDVVFWGGASCHLWFIASLLYAQLIFAGVYSCCRRMTGDYLLFAVISFVVVSISTLERTFLLTYPCRLLGFVALGIAIYGFLKRRTLALKIVLPFLIIGGVFHCLSAQWVHGFLRDWVLVAVIMLVFARSGMPVLGGDVAATLSRCSLGVFLIHPFFAAGVAAFVTRSFAAPYGCGVILGDWIVVYALALVSTLILLRVHWVDKLVR